MKEINWREYIEPALLALFVIVFFVMGPANVLDKRVSHNHPFNILASDAASEIAFVAMLRDQGSHRMMSASMCGGFEDCYGFFPYVFRHLALVFGMSAGLEDHQINILFTSFFLLIVCIMMFFLIKRWNSHIAYLSLPLMLFALLPRFNIGLMWGYYDVIVSAAFVIAIAYLLTQEKREKNWMLFAILLAASFLTHISEVIYATIFVGLFYLIRWIQKKKIDRESIRFFVKTYALVAVLIAYYAIIFLIFWDASDLIKGMPKPQWYDPVVQHFLIQEGIGGKIVQFLPLALLVGGIIISFFLLRKKSLVPILFGFTMVVFGFNPVGISFIRTFQIRYLWPVYLSMFFGLCLYFILSFLKLKKKEISAGVSALLIVFIGIALFMPSASAGIIDQNQWDAMQWMRYNTPQDAQVTVLYGDSYHQDATLWNYFRTSYRILEKSFKEHLENNKLSKVHLGRIVGPGDVDYAYWNGFLSLGRHRLEQEDHFVAPRNICLSDYIFFDIVSRTPVLAQFNVAVAGKMLEDQDFAVAYQNQRSVVLKNIKYNADCIVEGKINE